MKTGKLSPESSDNSNPSQALTISQLSRQIRKSIENHFPENIWITGEISEMRMHSSGHVYLELIEKDSQSENIKARIRAVIWSYNFRMLRPYFEGSTGYRLEAGLKIMMLASLEYHPQYGLSLNISDIDPSYTLGELAMKRAEIIEKLKSEGVLDMNRSIRLADVPQRVAIISSESAAGYGDFLTSLENNEYGYHFTLSLFPSLMQGDKAAGSVIKALEAIYGREDQFDLVVIIRGGGAKTDLECFNDYELALNVSQFPLPVLTGIGHERDDTIVDLVAYRALKTPTAVAEFLIDRILQFDSRLMEYIQDLSGHVRHSIVLNREKLGSLTMELRHRSESLLTREKTELSRQGFRLKSRTFSRIHSKQSELYEKGLKLILQSRSGIKSEKEKMERNSEKMKGILIKKFDQARTKLEQFDKLNNILDPSHILNRGYSITLYRGKVLKSSLDAKTGEEIVSLLGQGKIKSTITKKSS